MLGKRMGRPAMVLTLMTVFAHAPLSAESPSIPRIDPEGITVSGVSAGGVMAQQLHLAYPELFTGAGIVAGVPWGCAEGQLGLALGRCMGKADDALPVSELLAQYKEAVAKGSVGDPASLDGDRAWLFHGTLDSAVGARATEAAVAVYEALLPEGQVTFINDVEAAHHQPTLTAGVPCDQSAPPWLGACDYDAAGIMLSFLYGDLSSPSDAHSSEPATGGLVSVSMAGATAAGMADSAWVYLPEECPEEGCRLHVALHGCAMAEAQNGMAFMADSGYLPWARANDLVLLFPQVEAQPLNPLGCWDWWGYTGSNYLQRDGVQLKVIADWIVAASVR